MQVVSVEARDGLMREMVVELNSAEFDTAVEQRLQQYTRRVSIAGFRPGKAPVSVVRRHYGDRIRDEVFDDFVSTTFPTAIKQHRLLPVAFPQIEPHLDYAAKQYRYTARFEIFPEYELQPITGHTIRQPVVDVTDADVDAMIERLQRQHQTRKPIDSATAVGDEVIAKYRLTMNDGNTIVMAGEEQRWPVGQLVSAAPFPSFGDYLVGVTAPTQIDCDVQLPDDYSPMPAAAGQMVHCTIEVLSANAVLLPSIEELITAMEMGDKTPADFRAEISRNMRRESKQRVQQRVKDQVVRALMQLNPIPVPQTLVEAEARDLSEELMKTSSHKQNAYGLPPRFFHSIATHKVTVGLLLQRAIEQFEIQPSDDAVRAAVEDMAESYENPPALIEYYYADEKRLERVKMIVQEDLAVQRLLQDATVVEQPLRFMQLVDRDYADDDDAETASHPDAAAA